MADSDTTHAAAGAAPEPETAPGKSAGAAPSKAEPEPVKAEKLGPEPEPEKQAAKKDDKAGPEPEPEPEGKGKDARKKTKKKDDKAGPEPEPEAEAKTKPKKKAKKAEPKKKEKDAKQKPTEKPEVLYLENLAKGYFSSCEKVAKEVGKSLGTVGNTMQALVDARAMFGEQIEEHVPLERNQSTRAALNYVKENFDSMGVHGLPDPPTLLAAKVVLEETAATAKGFQKLVGGYKKKAEDLRGKLRTERSKAPSAPHDQDLLYWPWPDSAEQDDLDRLAAQYLKPQAGSASSLTLEAFVARCAEHAASTDSDSDSDRRKAHLLAAHASQQFARKSMTPEGRACWAVADTHFQALEKIFKKMSKDDLQDEEVKKQKGEIDKHATAISAIAKAVAAEGKEFSKLSEAMSSLEAERAAKMQRAMGDVLHAAIHFNAHGVEQFSSMSQALARHHMILPANLSLEIDAIVKGRNLMLSDSGMRLGPFRIGGK